MPRSRTKRRKAADSIPNKQKPGRNAGLFAGRHAKREARLLRHGRDDCFVVPPPCGEGGLAEGRSDGGWPSAFRMVSMTRQDRHSDVYEVRGHRVASAA